MPYYRRVVQEPGRADSPCRAGYRGKGGAEMTVNEIQAEISRLLERCNCNQLSLILRIVRDIVRG